jgi:hypothetical protein
MAAHNEDRERKGRRKCNRSYCYMHIYHKAIMTSFVSASKHKGREREREGGSSGWQGKAEELNHKAMDYKIISHGHTHTHWSLSLSLTILCVFISGMLLFTATPCCSVLLARPDPHSDSSSVAGSPSASPSPLRAALLSSPPQEDRGHTCTTTLRAAVLLSLVRRQSLRP